jgi:hypothetical protein
MKEVVDTTPGRQGRTCDEVDKSSLFRKEGTWITF